MEEAEKHYKEVRPQKLFVKPSVLYTCHNKWITSLNYNQTKHGLNFLFRPVVIKPIKHNKHTACSFLL